MADQDRTIKFTFSAEDKELKEALSAANKQVQELSDSIKKVASASSQKTIKGAPEAKGQVTASESVLKANEELLSVLKDIGKEYKDLIRQAKSFAAANTSNKGPGGPGDAAGLTSGGFGKKFAGIFGKIAMATVGAAGAAVAAQMRLGYGAYADYAKSLGGLAGTGVTYGQMEVARQTGTKYGYTPVQTAEQARAVAIATGQGGAVNTAQMFSRSTSLDVGQATDFMGSLTRAGSGFGGKGGVSGKKEFQNAINLGFKSGIDEARLPEYLQGVDKVLTAQGGRLGGDVSATNIARVLQAMGDTGHSGLQGARGATVLSKLDQGIANPGGGEAGKAIMLQAFGFGKPGGNKTYYEAMKQMQKGATPDNIKDVFSEFKGQYGGGEEEIIGLSNTFGLDYDVLEKLREAVQTMSGRGREDEIKKILKDSRSPESRAAESMEEVGFHSKRIAELQGRLVNIGADTYGEIVAIQDGINKMVGVALPLGAKILDISADEMRKSTRHIGDSYYKTPGEKIGEEEKSTWEMVKDFSSGVFGFALPEMQDNDFLPEHLRTDAKVGDLPSASKFSNKERKAIQAIIAADPKLQEKLNFAAESRGDAADDKRLLDMFRQDGAYHARMLGKAAEALHGSAKNLQEATKVSADAAGVPHIPAMLERRK